MSLLKLLALVPLIALSGCFQVQYLGQQAAGQWHLLRARRRIADVLADSATSDETRRKLRLAVAARDFGVRVLGLHDGDSYTRYYDTKNAPIAWNVSAADKDRLKPYSIRFPITGAVPYLGFFREADALAEKNRLDAQGFDTSMRPVSGYSTLGITSDPIYSSMLEGSDTRIVETVLHEMLHGTLYLAGHTEWNESLAEFVGVHGAAAFFEQGGNNVLAREALAGAAKVLSDEETFTRFLAPVLKALETLYASPRTRAEKLAFREAIFEKAHADFLALFPLAPGQKPGFFARTRLNNAVLLGYSIYHGGTPEHLRLYRRAGSDLARMIRLYKHAVDDEPDPIAWLKTR